MSLRSLKAKYRLVGMLKIRSVGVVTLLGTAIIENKEPITSVFPNPVIPFTKYAMNVAIKSRT
jgi:hypothetical protein